MKDMKKAEDNSLVTSKQGRGVS